MKKVVHGSFTWWGVDKEQAWLNEKIKQGWLLCDVRFMKYTFEPCEPDSYEICAVLLEKDAKTEASKDYISFVEETGATYIGARGSIAFFCKKKGDKPFELFSDRASWLKYYRHIRDNMRWFLAICVLFLANDILTVIGLCRGDTSMWAFDLLLLAVHVWFYCLVFPGYLKVRKLIRRLEQDEDIFEA